MLEHTGRLAKVGGWEVNLADMKLHWTRQTFEIADIEPPLEPTLEQGINLFAPQVRATVQAAIQTAIESGTSYDLELPIITQKGRHAWVRTQGHAEMRAGKAVRLYGTFQDITEQKQSLDSHLEAEQRHRLEQASALEAQRKSAQAALSLMEDAVTARHQAEAMSTTLNEQLDELRRWQQITQGRENRILSVKREVNDLLAAQGQPPRYPSALAEPPIDPPAAIPGAPREQV